MDVSGSMMPSNKLPLVKTAMKMLAERLTADDRVADRGLRRRQRARASGHGRQGRTHEIQEAIDSLRPRRIDQRSRRNSARLPHARPSTSSGAASTG
jgi:hypothetical protein